MHPSAGRKCRRLGRRQELSSPVVLSTQRRSKYKANRTQPHPFQRLETEPSSFPVAQTARARISRSGGRQLSPAGETTIAGSKRAFAHSVDRVFKCCPGCPTDASGRASGRRLGPRVGAGPAAGGLVRAVWTVPPPLPVAAVRATPISQERGALAGARSRIWLVGSTNVVHGGEPRWGRRWCGLASAGNGLALRIKIANARSDDANRSRWQIGSYALRCRNRRGCILVQAPRSSTTSRRMHVRRVDRTDVGCRTR